MLPRFAEILKGAMTVGHVFSTVNTLLGWLIPRHQPLRPRAPIPYLTPMHEKRPAAAGRPRPRALHISTVFRLPR